MDDITLETGDMIVDVVTGDVGLLVNRFDIMADIYANDRHRPALPPRPANSLSIWAWDIMWCGAAAIDADISRHQPFTEEGLINLLKSGTFIIKKRS